jgi:cytoskeletal protein RodZ
VSYRRRSQSASPLFLTLSVACLIGIIVLVWRNSEMVVRISHAITGETKNPPAIDNSVGTEASESPASKVSTKPVRSPLKSRPAAEVTHPDAPTPDEAPIVLPDPSHASAKSDSVVAYSSNSASSPVVYVLKKGERVETTLQLADATGRWTMIRTANSNRPAFVRSEDLEHATSAKISTLK